MANQRKSYFLVPGWDIPPAAIQLGNIIADPTRPQRALNSIPTARSDATGSTATGATMTSPGRTTNLISAEGPVIDTPVYSTSTKDFSAAISVGRSNKIGIWAQFLQIYGLGAEASMSLKCCMAATYSFEAMETEWFVPSRRFVRDIMQDEGVQGFLKMAGRSTPLYIITGLKTVRGATVSTSRAKNIAVTGKLGFDGTGEGVPVAVGPEVGHGSKRGEDVSWRSEGPVVFAFQVEQVRRKMRDWHLRDFNKGAMFGAGEETFDVEGQVEEVSEPLSLDELEDVEVREAVDEDGRECLVVVPVTDESQVD